jgi:hypothetical protein
MYCACAVQIAYLPRDPVERPGWAASYQPSLHDRDIMPSGAPVPAVNNLAGRVVAYNWINLNRMHTVRLPVAFGVLLVFGIFGVQ